MTDKEAIGWRLSEHRWFRISSLFFRRIQRCLRFRATALVIDPYVAESDVFDVVTWDAAYDRGVFRIRIVDDDVADNDASQCTHIGRLFGSSEATAEPEKDR